MFFLHYWYPIFICCVFSNSSCSFVDTQPFPQPLFFVSHPIPPLQFFAPHPSHSFQLFSLLSLILSKSFHSLCIQEKKKEFISKKFFVSNKISSNIIKCTPNTHQDLTIVVCFFIIFLERTT